MMEELRAVVGKQRGAQGGEGLPKVSQIIQLALRDSAEHGSIEIPTLGVLA